MTLAEARKLRAENAGLRDRLSTAETKVQEFDRASMTELQKAQADAKTATEAAEVARTALGQAALDAAARKLGMVDPTDAESLIAQVKYDAAGRPTNVEDLVRELTTRKPHLVDARSIGGSPANPGNGAGLGNGKPTFTESQLQDFDFWTKNRIAIEAAQADGRIVRGR